MSRRVLITGAAGLIGGLLRDGLAGEWDVSGVDARKRRPDGVERVDMTKLSAAERALAGAELVVDLAANPSPEISWGEAYENNMQAALNALEAARRAGVERLVYASSNHVTGLYERDEPYASILAGRYEGLDPDTVPRISASDPPRPDGPYAVAKGLGELAGRYYADALGLSVICLRIGTVNADGRPRNCRERATLLSHRDLVHLVDRSLRAPRDLRFAVYYGVSDNAWRIWEIADAQREIGYRPLDSADALA